MDVNGAAIVTPETVLTTGNWLMAVSTVAGIIALVYFACARPNSRASWLIAGDFSSFVNDFVPYTINFLICWYLSFAFEKLVVSSRLVVEATSAYYLPSKFILNVAAFATKHYLFVTRSNHFRTALFFGNIALVATSEAMCYEKYGRTATNVTLALLFWLTVLILVRRRNHVLRR